MSGPQRKALAELSKVWEAALAKGKMQTQEGLNNILSWVNDMLAKTSVQAAINEQIEKLNKLPKLPSTEEFSEKTRKKVRKMMKSYEQTIGLTEVRRAHARVLTAEAKFIHCQQERRSACKELLDVQNKLAEIRAELNRTTRGDESCLDLIKKEFKVIREARINRSRFEDLEREEREVFSELSNALRFSHEKERAQNAKTKYWSIVGSIIGAGLGILGTTINNRMKQNHMERILGATAFQIAAIQDAVENLSGKVSQGSTTALEVSHMITTLKEQEQLISKQREQLTQSIEESVKLLRKMFTAMSVYHNNKLLKVNAEMEVDSPPPDAESAARLRGEKWQIFTAVCILIAFLAFKYGF